MLSVPRWAAVAASLLLLSHRALAVPTPGDAELNRDGLAPRADDDWHWVATWTSMPQLVEQSNMPPSPFTGGGGVFKDATLRQTLHLSIGAERLRLQISNTFGGSDLPITAASIALPQGGKPGVAGIDAATLKPLTFNGSTSITIPRGQVAYTDPIDFSVPPQTNIAVSIYSQAGQSGNSITGHPGSRTTSHMQSGNRVSAATLSGGSNTKHWYFISAVEAWSPPTTHAFVILGDSITDGRGSTDDGNNRWPDLLLARMAKANANANLTIGVNNQAAGGNAVLSGGLGPTLLTRYKRDALQVAGVKYVMIFEGVNDIGGGGTDAGTQNGIGSRLQQAFAQIAKECKAAGIKTIGGTITPFGGSGQSYSNPTREQTRVKVNEWILGSGTFDATVDFAKLIGDSGTKSQLARQYDGGDHLHPNVAGYQAMAEGFPLDFFE
ncbi:SGNH hydrolase-type esterase domain-containing protein [Parachaetomium inaequale]|uniref:SGNH hydrolase-type esterase domain-containing protein n=1 Tax=Parachaetomium inaequale TaxID=2588326 RepID=A0AAN6SLJ3_9PEZI|nr:SGNH hydrolase-type esterase domain-containing protein [Parachaetomium inaequale]